MKFFFQVKSCEKYISAILLSSTYMIKYFSKILDADFEVYTICLTVDLLYISEKNASITSIDFRNCTHASAVVIIYLIAEG